MARYTGPQYKKSRRLGFSTLENGKELARRPYAPGAHGTDRRKKLSEYGVQLQEKQKVRFMYGLNEKQFHKVFEKASKMKGIAGENLLFLLESRLDNLVYRMGLSTTRRGARQLVNHGHITVNGRKVDIPSYTCKVGDVIESVTINGIVYELNYDYELNDLLLKVIYNSSDNYSIKFNISRTENESLTNLDITLNLTNSNFVSIN